MNICWSVIRYDIYVYNIITTCDLQTSTPRRLTHPIAYRKWCEHIVYDSLEFWKIYTSYIHNIVMKFTATSCVVSDEAVVTMVKTDDRIGFKIWAVLGMLGCNRARYQKSNVRSRHDTLYTQHIAMNPAQGVCRRTRIKNLRVMIIKFRRWWQTQVPLIPII